MRSPWNHCLVSWLRTAIHLIWMGLLTALMMTKTLLLFEIGAEKDDGIKDFLMTNLKNEVPNKENNFLSQETMKTEKKKVVTNIHPDVLGEKERKQNKKMKMRRKQRK